MILRFDANIQTIAGRRILRVPETESRKLPSRGMVYVQGTLDGKAFQAPLEPDGKGSHWMEISEDWGKGIEPPSGESVAVTMEAMEEWPEPMLPEDIRSAIESAGLPAWWESLTTKARWEWLRWIRSTKNPATRKKRIGDACSKMEKGERRPCCFNAQASTVPEVSKSGVLLEADPTE